MRYVLVTGACGGMGSATVRLLLSRGYGVFALDRAEAVGRGELPAGAISVSADITDEQSLLAAARQVREVTPQLYAVVHFAGMYALHSFIEMDTQALQRVFAVDLFGAMTVNKVFLPLLTAGSRIVLTTSELAVLHPLPFTGIYAVAKAALDDYAFSLAMEVQLLGIRVSVLRAGAVRTAMLPASTAALDRFCSDTQLYRYNAARFKRIVDRVEARSVPPERVAEKMLRILQKRRPGFAYRINRNPLLLLLNVLPPRLQLWIIRQVLR